MENKAKIDPKRFGILKAYQKGETIPDITAKFRHISRATIYRWIKEFKKGRVCRKTRKPTEEKKACYKTAMDLYGQGLSIAEIQREIKLVSSTTIRRWIMSSDTNSKDLSNDNEVLTSLQEEDSEKNDVLYDGMTPEELLTRYRQLLEQNRRQKVQLTLAETMIDVAEEEFGIAIRKKAGAKESEESTRKISMLIRFCCFANYLAKQNRLITNRSQNISFWRR